MCEFAIWGICLTLNINQLEHKVDSMQNDGGPP